MSDKYRPADAPAAEHQDLVYKPLAMIAADLGGVIAVAMFDRLWTRLRGDRARPAESPAADRVWYSEALIAALQGGTYAGAKALLRRNRGAVRRPEPSAVAGKRHGGGPNRSATP